MKDMKFRSKFFCIFKKRNYYIAQQIRMKIADGNRLTLFIDIGHNNSLSQSLCDKSLPYGIIC